MVLSFEMLFLLDPAQGLFRLEGNIEHGVIGETCLETRSLRPVRATHYVIKVTSEPQRFLAES
jgi:hypothetical protein